MDSPSSSSPFTPASASVVLDIAEPNNYSQWCCFMDGRGGDGSNSSGPTNVAGPSADTLPALTPPLAAGAGAGVPPAGTTSSDRFDTVATSHMASTPATRTQLQLAPTPTPLCLPKPDDGAQIPTPLGLGLRTFAALVCSWLLHLCYSVCKWFTKQFQAIAGIQTSVIAFLCHQPSQRKRRRAAVLIQRVFRGWLARKRLLGSSRRNYTRLCVVEQSQWKRCHQSLELSIVVHSVTRIQRWWRKFLLRQSVKTTAVLVIQAHFRRWKAQQIAFTTRKSITTIQSYVKAYLLRKALKREVRIMSILQKSSQVDRMRLNTLTTVSQLLRSESKRNILQSCRTLRTATEDSKECCEELVNDGSVHILLGRIHSLNRGSADEEIRKQVLHTLKNIAHCPNLRQGLANTPKFAETIFQELLRNKEEDVFFIAFDILKSLCDSKESRHGTVKGLGPSKRMLHVLVQRLKNKLELHSRPPMPGPLVSPAKAKTLRERLWAVKTLLRTLCIGC